MGKNQIITDNSKVNINLLKQNEELKEQNKELIKCFKEIQEYHGIENIKSRILDIIQKHESINAKL